MDATRGRAGAIAAELIVVFVGVLVALGADSWWDQRQERQRLHGNLEALARDMVSGDSDVAATIRLDSTTAAELGRVREALLSEARGATMVSAEFDDYSINVPPLPLGTLRLVVQSGDVRLVEGEEYRQDLIQGLARLELVQGWLDDLATEARRAGEAATRARDQSRVSGLTWPEAAFGDVEVTTSLSVVEDRLENIVVLLRAVRRILAVIEFAALSELGLEGRAQLNAP